MEALYVVRAERISGGLERMLEAALGDREFVVVSDFEDMPCLKGKKILFVGELNAAGFCSYLIEFFSVLYKKDVDSLEGCTGAVIVSSSSDLYTKNFAQEIVFLANRLGCQFIGHSVVEATKGYKNFLTWKKTLKLPLENICLKQCEKLGDRLYEFEAVKFERPKVLVLHSSFRKTSNTLMLWNMVKKNLHDCDITELHVENGKVLDCVGCPFKTCLHYSQQSSCFYGGFMVDEILPAIEKADAIVWICPNYNDSVSANISAVINRLTALYRKISFYNKSIFSVIVSGNSGSDSVARRLIGSLNINKGFMLPSNFAIMETANDPKSISKVPLIEEKAKAFAKNMMKHMLSNKLQL